MLARCARCQGTFSTDRFGRQTCPHCGAELILPDPSGGPAPSEPQPPEPAASPGPPPPPGHEPAHAAPEPPPATAAGAGGPPPAGGLPPPPPGSGWGPPPPPTPPPPPSPAGPELPSPFAERARLGFFASFLETWKLVATQPQHFFSRVRIDQTGSALLFGVIASTVGNVASSIYAYFSGQQAIVAMQQLIENAPAEQARLLRIYAEALTGGSLLAQIVLSPLITLVFIYLASAVLHLLLTLFRGAHRGFDATLTMVAYASGLLLLLALPGCGAVLAGVWGLVATVIGLGAIQRCGMGKSAAAVLAPAVLVCVCCCGVLGLAVPAFLKGAEEAANQGQGTAL